MLEKEKDVSSNENLYRKSFREACPDSQGLGRVDKAHDSDVDSAVLQKRQQRMSQSFTSLLTIIGQRINIAKHSSSMSPGFQIKESQMLVSFSGPQDV